MTTNQINYMRALESERSNRASEAIKAMEARVHQTEAETRRGQAYAEYGLTFNPDGTISYDPTIGTANRTVSAAERNAYFGSGRFGDAARTFQNIGETLRDWWDAGGKSLFREWKPGSRNLTNLM